MQKALQQMNLLLHNVVSDIVGVTGLAIIRAILAGEHNPQVLAQHRDYRCKHSEAEIAKSVVGNYREEYLFALEQALTLYESYQAQIAACDARSEAYLQALPTVVEDTPPPNTKTSKPQKYRFAFDLRTYLYQFTGTDLKRIHGIDVATALTVVSEIGTDMSRWKSAKHFVSWLGLCPGTKVSGGKVLSSKTKPTANRAATALRIAASSLYNSQTALGAYLRRMTTRLGKPKAVTATAHKLARLVYCLLRGGGEYVDVGQDYYEQRYRERVVRSLEQRAKAFGLALVPQQPQEAVT